MRNASLFAALLMPFAALPASAQLRPAPRPLPRIQVVSQGQPVRIFFHTTADTNAAQFQGMDAYFSDGTVTANWTIPAGKMLILTDFSMTNFLLTRLNYDVEGGLMEYYPNGASLSILPFEFKAGRQTVTTTGSLSTGLAYTQPNGPSLGLLSDTAQGFSLQSTELWGFGYITDAN